MTNLVQLCSSALVRGGKHLRRASARGSQRDDEYTVASRQKLRRGWPEQKYSNGQGCNEVLTRIVT